MAAMYIVQALLSNTLSQKSSPQFTPSQMLKQQGEEDQGMARNHTRLLSTAQMPDRSRQEASSFNLDITPQEGRHSSIFRKGAFGSEISEEEESTAEFKLKSTTNSGLNVDLGQIFGIPSSNTLFSSSEMDVEEAQFTIEDLPHPVGDLNACVDEILSKKKIDYEGKTVIRFCSKKASKEKRKRTRKDRGQ